MIILREKISLTDPRTGISMLNGELNGTLRTHDIENDCSFGHRRSRRLGSICQSIRTFLLILIKFNKISSRAHSGPLLFDPFL